MASVLLCLGLAFFVLGAAVISSGRNVSAAGGAAALYQTSGTVPPAQGSQPPPPPKGSGVSTLAPGVSTAPAAVGGTAGTNGGNNSGGFPWWVLGIVVVLALAGAGYAVMRSMRPADRATAGGPAYAGASPKPAAGSVAPYVGAAGAATVAVPQVGGQVKCPNCGTMNAANENFCHECGQDLRALRAPVTGVPVEDIVDEYTPYLETTGRSDEQLEYVLSRARVAVGSGAGNDIVVDPVFGGYNTVSRVHAELQRREDGGFTVKDAGSEAGTFVNGERVTERALAEGDRVRLGDVEFIYHAPERPQAS